MVARSRDKLESAAQEMVQRKGINGLSFRTLATEVGIKSSSVHYHFPEKSDLGAALIQRYSQEFFASLEEIAQTGTSLKGKLKSFIDIFEQVGSQNKLCLCGMMAAEFEQLSSENQQLLADYFENTEKWLIRQLEAHKGDYSAVQNRKVLARMIISSLEGALLLDRIQGSASHISAQRSVINQVIFG